MFYQLPTGKVVYVSTEEFLSLKDEDFPGFVQNLIASNTGITPTSSWHGSVLNKPQTKSNEESSDEESPDDLDYRTFEESDGEVNSDFDINQIPDDETNFNE
tara:strand:- start:1947 stop:2252 length:306 start_codon:yes stop_codon:yes gene_type:complete